MNERQGDQADDVDHDPQSQRDHEQLGGLAPDELDAGVDAEGRDQGQGEPSVVLRCRMLHASTG